jgi:hypothetical protein
MPPRHRRPTDAIVRSARPRPMLAPSERPTSRSTRQAPAPSWCVTNISTHSDFKKAGGGQCASVQADCAPGQDDPPGLLDTAPLSGAPFPEHSAVAGGQNLMTTFAFTLTFTTAAAVGRIEIYFGFSGLGGMFRMQSAAILSGNVGAGRATSDQVMVPVPPYASLPVSQLANFKLDGNENYNGNRLLSLHLYGSRYEFADQQAHFRGVIVGSLDLTTTAEYLPPTHPAAAIARSSTGLPPPPVVRGSSPAPTPPVVPPPSPTPPSIIPPPPAVVPPATAQHHHHHHRRHHPAQPAVRLVYRGDGSILMTNLPHDTFRP